MSEAAPTATTATDTQPASQPVSRSIFNPKASEKLRSPDDLDKFIRVTNPSVWIVLGACLAIVIGLLAWGIFGAVTTSVGTTGTCINSKAVCFLSAEDVAKVSEGNTAVVDGIPMTVSKVAEIPLSPDEANKMLKSDYLVSALVKGEWAYPVEFDGDASQLAEGVPLSVNITTERIAPISLIVSRQPTT